MTRLVTLTACADCGHGHRLRDMYPTMHGPLCVGCANRRADEYWKLAKEGRKS